jgi:hypothetical protein
MSEPTPLVKAVLALRAPCNEQYDAWSKATPENARIRAVATAIFRANWGDQDPTEPVMGVPYNSHPDNKGQTQWYLGKGTVAFRFPIQPAWATYLQDARAAIEAVDAYKSGGT